MSSLPQPTVYPQSISTRAAAAGSTGSFGPVFVVLAVIAVLAIIACVLGRLCARRLSKPRATHVAKDDVESGGFAVKLPAPVAAGRMEAKGDQRYAGYGVGMKANAAAFKHPGSGGKRTDAMPTSFIEIRPSK